MKKITSCTLLAITMYAVAFTQSEVPEDSSWRHNTYVVVEEMPEFPGGKEALKEYLDSSMVYPAMALEANVKGLVMVEFLIDEQGSISRIKVLKGLGYGCDEEVIRVISRMPMWTPGYQDGKAVRVLYRLPVRFPPGTNKN